MRLMTRIEKCDDSRDDVWASTGEPATSNTRMAAAGRRSEVL
jgi:hypothetical protein